MKLVSFSHKGRSPRIGFLGEDTITATDWRGNMFTLIQSGLTPNTTSERFPLDECQFKASFRPNKIICIGRNYAEHAAELGNDAPKKPHLFAKLPSSVIGPDEKICWSESITTQVDWEGELGVVIGKAASKVSEEDAMKHVFGYVAALDISARDLQDAEAQWLRAKSLDTFCPLGSMIVTRKEIEDPQKLSVKTTVNGEVMQDGNTKDMIFSIKHLISYISHSIKLEPGDLILTGTPSGVGKGRKPPVFLKDGDVVSVEIEGVGSVTNTCQVVE